MALYISRNGQQSGPYSLTEAQEQVRMGTIAITDLAWHEGLPGWVPLHQISGLSIQPPAPPVPTPLEITNPAHPFAPKPEPKKSLLQKIGIGIVGIVVIALKFKFVLLFFFKTGLTMLLSIGAYSLLYGWKFATGLVLLIFVHEMGHFVAAKCYRIPVSAPVFIPFMGAYVLLKNHLMNSWTNAIVSYAGPLAGTLGGWVCLELGLFLEQPWMVAVAFYTFIINMINLLPVLPLDGSYIWIAFNRRLTPGMSLSERLYIGLFLAALIAAMTLGCLQSWAHLHPTHSDYSAF